MPFSLSKNFVYPLSLANYSALPELNPGSCPYKTLCSPELYLIDATYPYSGSIIISFISGSLPALYASIKIFD